MNIIKLVCITLQHYNKMSTSTLPKKKKGTKPYYKVSHFFQAGAELCQGKIRKSIRKARKCVKKAIKCVRKAEEKYQESQESVRKPKKSIRKAKKSVRKVSG